MVESLGRIAIYTKGFFVTEEGVFVERLFNGSGLIECLCNSSLGFFVSLCKYIKALACPSDVLIFLTTGSFVKKRITAEAIAAKRIRASLAPRLSQKTHYALSFATAL